MALTKSYTSVIWNLATQKEFYSSLERNEYLSRSAAELTPILFNVGAADGVSVATMPVMLGPSLKQQEIPVSNSPSSNPFNETRSQLENAF